MTTKSYKKIVSPVYFWNLPHCTGVARYICQEEKKNEKWPTRSVRVYDTLLYLTQVMGRMR